jgi:hypothetical protein
VGHPDDEVEDQLLGEVGVQGLPQRPAAGQVAYAVRACGRSVTAS